MIEEKPKMEYGFSEVTLIQCMKNKELLLKDLSARFPYGVKVRIEADNCTDEINTLNLTDLNSFIKNSPRNEDWCDVVTSIKPYLRPMSSMTKKEKKEYEGFFPYNEDTLDYAIDYALEHHLDYRGLIPMGLALPALKDMYNFK